MLSIDPHQVVERLKEFQRAVRDQVIASRRTAGLHVVDRATAADTIYAIDTVVEPILESFCREWSKTTPLVLIAEGIQAEGIEGTKVFPDGASETDAQIRLIVDPIDGTRGLMYDKRAAWALAGVAPNNGAGTRLRGIEIAGMTEVATSNVGQATAMLSTKRS